MNRLYTRQSTDENNISSCLCLCAGQGNRPICLGNHPALSWALGYVFVQYSPIYFHSLPNKPSLFLYLNTAIFLLQFLKKKKWNSHQSFYFPLCCLSLNHGCRFVLFFIAVHKQRPSPMDSGVLNLTLQRLFNLTRLTSEAHCCALTHFCW